MAQGTITLDRAPRQPARGTAMSLTAEQRRALALLTSAGRDGMTQSLLTTLGFDASVIAGLVNEGLATQTLSRGRADGNTDFVRIRIKAAGRRAIKG